MTLQRLFVLSACFFLSGCWFSNRTIPMPLNETEFPKPIQKTLTFSAPRKIKWNVVPADSIHRGRMYPFDISKMPSQPFNPIGLKKLPVSIKSKPFHYHSLPDTTLNLNAIPNQPLNSKTMLLGRIKKTILGLPKLHAESYHTFFQYDEEQGLPSQTTEAILRTRDGRLWIGSDGGLCIANGESLETLPFNYGPIFFMVEDSLGQVWITTRNNGLFVVDRKAGIQKQFNDFKFLVEVRADAKGYIWVTSFREGLYIINPDQKTFKHLDSKNGLGTDFVIRTMEDRDGRVWISSFSKGIDILDPELKKIKRLGDELGKTSLREIQAMKQVRNGDVYVSGFRRSVDIFNLKNDTHQFLDSVPGVSSGETFDINEDTLNRKWITTDSSGMAVLNQSNDSLYHIGPGDGLAEGITLGLYKDQLQMANTGSAQGFNMFPPDDQTSHHLSKKDGFLDNNIWSIFEDSLHRIWFGSYQGLNILTPDQQLHQFQVHDPVLNSERIDAVVQTGPGKFALTGPGSGLSLVDESSHTLEKIGMKEGLPTNSIRYLNEDSQGILWLETNDAGIILFDPVKRTIRYLNQASGLGSNRVSAMQELGPGIYWLATFAGIELLDLNQNTVADYSTKEGLSNDQALTVFKDSKNRFWVSTEKGLNLLEPDKGTNTIFTTSNGMPSNGIYSLLEKDGRIYAGTGKGLTVLEEISNTVQGSKESYWNLQTYGKSLGLNNMDFNGNTALISHSGQFWWGILPGLELMDASALKTDSSPAPPQLVSIDILQKSQYFIDPSLIRNIDTLWSDTRDSFFLKNSFENLNTDKQKGIEWTELSSTNLPVGLSLPSDRNYLRFHFGNILPQYNGDYKYMYILDGVDEKWSSITDQPFSENYNNISPGYYSFRVSARKGLGPWSEPSVFSFRIRPPWWQSWWAELLYFLFFAGLVRFWVRYRSRRLLKENLMLEQKVSERTTALTTSLENLRQAQGQLIQAEKMASLGELTAGIAHEIQNPLNFVNNFSEVNTELIDEVNKALDGGDVPEAKELLKDVEMNMEKITFHGKRADAIVKGMLLHSRASSSQKIPTNVNTLADEYLRLSYHGLRAKDKSFNAQFTMDLDEHMVEIPLVQQNIGRVFLNLFNNAFYSVTEKKKLIPEGYEPTVSVATHKKKDSVEIRIRDNGLGIPKKVLDKIYQPFFTTKPAGQGTGLGLSLSYDIVTKEHGGKIDVLTKENDFTEFIIELPFNA